MRRSREKLSDDRFAIIGKRHRYTSDYNPEAATAGFVSQINSVFAATSQSMLPQ